MLIQTRIVLKECVVIESKRQRGKVCVFPHCVPALFVSLCLMPAFFLLLLVVDRIYRAPFVEPVFSFPKEYIDMLKGTLLDESICLGTVGLLFCILFALSHLLLFLQLDIPDGLFMVVLIMCANIVLLFSGIMREYRIKVTVTKFVIMDVVVGVGCLYLRIELSLHLFKS